MRRTLVLIGVLAAAGCGDVSTELPPSSPVITLDGGARDAGPNDAGADAGETDAGPPDAGPPDSGPPDSGQAFIDQCADAGCALTACEPRDGGTIRCGVFCGDACQNLCDTDRCDDPDAGWTKVFCTGPAGARAWSTAPDCDDGNVCTTADRCSAGACAGSPADTSVGCDDGNVCTTGDHCDGNGGCTGTRASGDLHRFANASASTYSYAAAGGWSFNGWTDDGVIYASVPGGQPIHLLFDSTAVDRILSLATSSGSYADSSLKAGTGLAAAANGAVELQVASFTCGTVNSSCSTVGGANAKRHYFFTAGHGSPPAGTPGGAGIWVCPP